MSTLCTGGCLCQSVRYEAAPISNTAYYCHCRDCQIGSGSAFHVAVFSEQKAFKLTAGEFSCYETVADSGRALQRLFCGQCGTPVAWTGKGFPEIVLLTLSSLDDPEAFPPVHEGWTRSAVSWCRIGEQVKSFAGRPERKELDQKRPI